MCQQLSCSFERVQLLSYSSLEGISLPGAMSIAWMCLGRLISGCAVGLLSTVVALYQSEVAPAHMRGGLTSLQLAGLEVELSMVALDACIWVVNQK